MIAGLSAGSCDGTMYTFQITWLGYPKLIAYNHTKIPTLKKSLNPSYTKHTPICTCSTWDGCVEAAGGVPVPLTEVHNAQKLTWTNMYLTLHHILLAVPEVTLGFVPVPLTEAALKCYNQYKNQKENIESFFSINHTTLTCINYAPFCACSTWGASREAAGEVPVPLTEAACDWGAGWCHRPSHHRTGLNAWSVSRMGVLPLYLVVNPQTVEIHLHL